MKIFTFLLIVFLTAANSFGSAEEGAMFSVEIVEQVVEHQPQPESNEHCENQEPDSENDFVFVSYNSNKVSFPTRINELLPQKPKILFTEKLLRPPQA